MVPGLGSEGLGFGVVGVRWLTQAGRQVERGRHFKDGSLWQEVWQSEG